MPIYEFQCSECEKVTEHLLKMSDPAPTECPECGKSAEMRKLMSQAAFHLKGGGWYSDAYSSKPTDKKPSKEGATTESTKSGSSDSKPESKSDSSSGSKPAAKTSTKSSD